MKIRKSLQTNRQFWDAIYGKEFVYNYENLSRFYIEYYNDLEKQLQDSGSEYMIKSENSGIESDATNNNDLWLKT